MKTLIKQTLRKKLIEVIISKHSYDRAEERVWGNQKNSNGSFNSDPPTINKDAWENELKYNKIDIPTSNGIKEISVTNNARDIISKLNYIKNNLKVNVTLNEDESINLIIFSSHAQNRGGGIWGTVLTGVVRESGREGIMTTIQWQNTQDLVTLRGGKFGHPKYIISVENLLKNGVSELNDYNVGNLALYPRPKMVSKSEPQKTEKYRKIKLNDGSEVKYFSNLNKFQTMDGKEINADTIYDKLSQEMQDIVLNAMV